MINYSNINYWDGFSNGLSEGDIFVSGEHFEEPGEQEKIEVRDMSGLFAIPGLIDAHVHMCLNPDVKDPHRQTDPDDEQIKQEIRDRAAAMLRAGITTARDLGGGEYLELEIRDEINTAQTIGPRLICAGQPITSVAGHCHFWGGEAASTIEALKVLHRQHEHSVDLIKVMVTGGNITPGSQPRDSQFSDDTIASIVSTAAGLDYHVAAHCHGTDGIRQAAIAGVRTVEHCSWVGDAGWGKAFDEQVVAALADNNVWVSPTINFGWRRFTGKEFTERVLGNYEKMKLAGVKLIASTDAGIPNVYHHDLPKALPVFGRIAGLSSIEVLRSATSDCARAIGLGDTTGRITTGYSADFVVYEENPLLDLSVLEKPILVVSRGRALEIR